jgi:hypothetical protein
VNGSLGDGLWKYGSLLGIFEVLFPVLYFLIGTPKIGQDLQRLLVADELPTAVIAATLFLNEDVS